MSEKHDLTRVEMEDIGNYLVNVALGQDEDVVPKNLNEEIKRLTRTFAEQGATRELLISLYQETLRARGCELTYWPRAVASR